MNDHLCPEHQKRLGGLCLTQPCSNQALPGKRTCGLKEHIQAYNKFKARGSSNFALTSMLNRPGSNRPSDPTVHQDWNTAELIGLNNIQQADKADRAHEQAHEGGDLPKTKGCRVCFSRKKTHNDQLIVSCCGVILARETFFNSESLSAVRAFLLRTPTPDASSLLLRQRLQACRPHLQRDRGPHSVCELLTHFTSAATKKVTSFVSITPIPSCSLNCKMNMAGFSTHQQQK